MAAPSLRRQRLCGRQVAKYAHQIRHWTIEIVRRMADTIGFEVLPRRWVVERTLAWLNRNRRLAKDFEGQSPAPRPGFISPRSSFSLGD